MYMELIITSEHGTRLPFGWFLKSKILQSSKYASHPVILRGAEGEVAESILPTKNPRPPGEGGPAKTVRDGKL